MPLRFGEEFLDGANYHSIKTQGNNLYKRARFKGALNAYETALALNPRSKTIILEKSKCLAQMGDVDKALREVDRMYGSGKQKPPDYRGAGGGNRNQQESLSELSYKCRYLLNKADALYNKGDFENALVLYHKGHRLRPKAPEFRLGIAKTEDALKVMFTEVEKEKKQESKKSLSKENLKAEKPLKQVVQPESKKSTNDTNKNKEGTPNTQNNKNKDTKEDDKVQTEEASKETKANQSNEKPKEESKIEKPNTSEKATENNEIKPISKILTDEQKENIKATLAERKQRIREARLQFAIREREEARKIRAKYTGRPSGHLSDDLEFLRMIYKNLKTQSVPAKRAHKLTKEAIGYIDTRNNFWNQQMPHHIREKSHVIQLPKGKTPPPTQAMFAFVIKETIRINGMMEKKQWHRSIETSKKLIEHIKKMERKIPNRESLIANILSLIGNAYFELEEDKKAMKFHLQDLHMASEFDLDEAKSRALDNLARVYIRLGEFEKAVAVWEQKMSSDFEISPGERTWIYHEMGYCYMEIDMPERAKECGDKSYEAATEKEDKKWQLNAKLLTAQALLRCGEAYESKDEFENAGKIAAEIKDEGAQEKIDSALKEIGGVLAEWDYMDDEEEDEDQINKQQSQSQSEVDYNRVEEDVRMSDKQQSYSPLSNTAPQDKGSNRNRPDSEERENRRRSKPITKHTKDSDVLFVEEEQNRQENDRVSDTDHDNVIYSEKVTTEPPKSESPTVVFLGTVKDQPAANKNDKSTNNIKDTGQKRTTTKPVGNVKHRNTNVRNYKSETVNRSREPKKEPVRQKEPVYHGKVGPDTTSHKNNQQSKPESMSTPKPKRENSNASMTVDKTAIKPKRENSNASMTVDKMTSKPKRENSNASMTVDKATSKPKRENSNASMAKAKPPRQNSNASLKPNPAREPSFVKVPKREPSYQSMKGRLSREGSNVSRLTNRTNLKERPQENEEQQLTHRPRITQHDQAAAIYLNKPLSRESSIISKKTIIGKAPRDTSKDVDNFSRKPTKEEIKLNTEAIDLVAAMNDPEKTFVDDADKTKDKAFITEKSNMTASTAVPIDR